MANVSGTVQDVDSRKSALSTTILPMFDENDLINFGPQRKKFRAYKCLRTQNQPVLLLLQR